MKSEMLPRGNIKDMEDLANESSCRRSSLPSKYLEMLLRCSVLVPFSVGFN